MVKRSIERICKNCKLFNPKNKECSVVILFEGQRHHIPVDAEDACFFEAEHFDPTIQAMDNFAQDIQEVKFWVEDEKGQKTSGDGTVKIEYPDGFFGED